MKRNTDKLKLQHRNCLLVLRFTMLFILMMMYLAACGESPNPVSGPTDNYTGQIQNAPNLAAFVDAPWDVNGDGIVDILDMIIVAQHFGEAVPPRPTNNQPPPSCVPEPDTTPPAIPRGVYSITGDEEVIIEWFPNGEDDLAGYRVWRSRDDVDFDLLDEVSPDTTSYVDRNVRNGETYYYAVSAFDNDDNESDLSPEVVDDTPRPEGRNVTLRDYQLSPERSGFDFSRPARVPIQWDDINTDIYFGFDPDVNVPYMYSDNDTIMQDMGYRDSIDDLDEAPLFDLGYTTLFVELLEGHVYAFYTPDGNYAKIRVLDVSDVSVTFDWAYQIDPDNPELAPPLSLKNRSSGCLLVRQSTDKEINR